jgi:PAS domain S-box-containing protein
MARIYAEDMPLVARHGSWQGEWTLQARDGTQIPVAVTQHLHHAPHGRGAYVSGIMRDLRPRLARERALRESERRLAEAEGVAGLGSWEWVLGGNAVAWSKGMYEIHGLDPARYPSSFDNWVATVHPDDRALAQRAGRAAADGEGRLDFTYRALHADGRVLVMHGRGERITGDGQPPRLVGTLRDITEQHAAEKALRDSEERARIVIATAGDAYIQFDADGLVTDWNRQAETTFGWARQEALGRPLSALVIRPHDRAAYEDRLGLSGDNNPFLGDRFELPVLHRSGREFPAEFTVWPITGGDAAVFGTFVRDISERRAVERAKDEFVSVVSHELRTPLTSIHGALGLLRAGLFGELTERGQRMVDIAVDNTDRLVRLINDILDIERLDSGKVTLNRERCDAAPLVARSVESMQALAAEAGVRLETDVGPATLWADPDRIEQTMTNLLSNAIKFSQGGSTVWVQARPDDGELVVRVRDEGRGIPADQLESIFGRFQQVDASDARAKGGTGLGLAICRTIVEQHGGRIWADSELGGGATFTFTLPLVPPADGAALRGQTVLVCDDDPAVREIVVAVLESHGYHGVEVASGSELVDAAVSYRPAAILLDLLMPGVDGWEAAAALAERPDTRDIPVLILSVLNREAAEGPGDIAGWLDKPIDAHALVTAVHRAVGHAAAGPQLLLVEDDEDLAAVLVERFRRLGVEVHHASTARRALDLSARLVPDLLVLDLLLPDRDGYAVVAELRRDDRLRGVPLVVYTACDLSQAERARLRLGETEFFTKSRVSPEAFERHVVGLLDHLTKTTGSNDRV